MNLYPFEKEKKFEILFWRVDSLPFMEFIRMYINRMFYSIWDAWFYREE